MKQDKITIDLFFNSVDTIKIRGFGKVEASPNPLNTINLLNQGLSCIEPILDVSLSKIHNIFSILNTFFLSQLDQYKQLQLSFRKRVSTFEIHFSTFDRFDFLLTLVENINFFVDSIKKDHKMQDDGYISQLSGSNSTKTQQNSTVLNFNSTKLSEWAKLFIKNNQLTQSNLKNSSQFKNLNLKQKQAIYYQLRKKTPKINKFSKSSKTKEVEKTGFNLALLSMIPVFFSEYLILTFSYLFYVGLGFSFEVACISALCVEFFYMLSSSSDRVQLKILRWVIFAYSAFTVCFATYSNDSQFKNYRNLQTKTIFELESQLLQQKKISKSLLKRETGLLADMEVYRKNEMITLGRSRLAGEKAQIHSAMSQNQNKTESLISKINLEKKSQLSRGAFSIDNLKLIEVKTWSVMAFLILIQLLSSICTNEFFKALRLRPKNKSKRRTHKKKRRDDHGGIAKSKLNLH